MDGGVALAVGVELDVGEELDVELTVEVEPVFRAGLGLLGCCLEDLLFLDSKDIFSVCSSSLDKTFMWNSAIDFCCSTSKLVNWDTIVAKSCDSPLALTWDVSPSMTKEDSIVEINMQGTKKQ